MITEEFFRNGLPENERAVLALLLLLAGAMIGYFAAEMMMQKTLRVFRGKWRPLLAVWGVLALFFTVCEFDLTGYETRLPEFDEIECASFGAYTTSVLEDRENIGELYALHKSVIENKALHERAAKDLLFNIRYTMKDGREFDRSYHLSVTDGQEADPASDVSRLQELTNTPEAILSRHKTKMELVPANIDRCLVYTQIREDGRNFENQLELPPETAYALYTEAILPDMEEGTIGCSYFTEEAAKRKLSDTTVTIELREKDQNMTANRAGIRYPVSFDYMSFCVQMDSRRTMQCLQNSAGLEIRPMDGEIATRPVSVP